MLRGSSIIAALVACLAFAAPASADDWLPHPADASWTYEWTDSAYSASPTTEKVTVKESSGASFSLDWKTESPKPPEAEDNFVSFQESPFGTFATNWRSGAPSSAFPILCSSASRCGNSLASTLYNVIWGSRSPLLVSPLVRGATWNSVGGQDNDVGGASRYLGFESITVPAFPMPVLAAKVRSQIAQAGAIGDPYGSGVRTTWWLYGVGPIKITFEHVGGSSAPTTSAVLKSTNLTPKPPPNDADYFPLKKGLTGTYRWTNSKHFEKPVVQRYTVVEVLNGSARLDVKSVSGPIRAEASYVFTSRRDGVTNISGSTRAASLVRLPPLGPKALPKDERRHFFTPFDLMTFGFNPVLPAYPASGNSWSGRSSGRDFQIYGVTGTTKVTGVQTVKVPAGTFRALVVGSTLKQAGFPFGSGTRTSWFAPGKGLVKLVFRHGDGSTSVVELTR